MITQQIFLFTKEVPSTRDTKFCFVFNKSTGERNTTMKHNCKHLQNYNSLVFAFLRDGTKMNNSVVKANFDNEVTSIEFTLSNSTGIAMFM